MPLISLHQVSMSYRGPQLLSEVCCRIEAGDKIGLMGRNGVGKSTLLRLLSQVEKPESGIIEFSPGIQIATLSQDVPEGIEGSVSDVIAAGFQGDLLLDENAWKREQYLSQTLTNLGLDGHSRFETISTGLKRRTLLGRAIVCRPDVLLLDEPTNHLDIDAITWLEGFLASYPTTLIFVTHDRAFLTRLANRILEIDRGRLFDWSCDYPTFLKRKEMALQAEEKQQALFDKRLAEEEVWIRTGIKARRTRNEGRVRRLEEMRRLRAKRPKSLGSVNMQFDSGERSGNLVCQLESASFGYGSKCILQPFDLTIMRGDKIGILGRNGAGKSTLLKGLLGKLPAMSGKVRLGTKLEIAYFDQNRESLDLDKTAEENVGQGKTTIQVPGGTKHIMGYLQDFLFTPEQIRSPVRFFSGGQLNRLLLAKLLARPANLLVMDEPTNDLDSETLELLEEKLVDYDGTLLVVSHDRQFLNNCVTSMLVFENQGIKEYVGGYDDWLRQRKVDGNPEPTKTANKPVGSDKRVDADKGTARKLSFKEKIELDQLPERIEALEAEQGALQMKMSQIDYYKTSPAAQAADQTRMKKLEGELEQAYSRVEELMERG
jgi:ATP-binding cassette subfamily F protein uup